MTKLVSSSLIGVWLLTGSPSFWAAHCSQRCFSIFLPFLISVRWTVAGLLQLSHFMAILTRPMSTRPAARGLTRERSRSTNRISRWVQRQSQCRQAVAMRSVVVVEIGTGHGDHADCSCRFPDLDTRPAAPFGSRSDRRRCAAPRSRPTGSARRTAARRSGGGCAAARRSRRRSRSSSWKSITTPIESSCGAATVTWTRQLCPCSGSSEPSYRRRAMGGGEIARGGDFERHRGHV